MASHDQPPGPGGSANPGWYPDPWGRSAWRWWDGWNWSSWVSPPESVTPDVIRSITVEPRSPTAAVPEAPMRERLPGGAPAGVGPGLVAPTMNPMAGIRSVTRPAPGGNRPVAYGAQPAPAALRGRLIAELVIVLAVFPLPSTVAAVQILVGSVLGEKSPSRLPVVFPGHNGAAFPFLLLEVLLPLAGGFLVIYLLRYSGFDGGVRSIGLSRDLWRTDAALVLPVFLVAFVLPQVGILDLLRNIGLKIISPGLGHYPRYYVIILVALGLVSAFAEEVVVLGYLVRRLEQLGCRPTVVVLVATAVRCSYHLYYGWGALAIAGWAVVSVLLYRRWRRLAPFMIVHALWDTGLTLAQSFGPKVLTIEAALLLLPTLVLTLVWREWIPRPASRLPRPG